MTCVTARLAGFLGTSVGNLIEHLPTLLSRRRTAGIAGVNALLVREWNLRTCNAHKHEAGVCLLLSVLALTAQAQQRPDSGSLAQESNKLLTAPAPTADAPQVTLPKVKRALSVQSQSGWAEKVRVTGFQISGNSIFDSNTLLAQVHGITGEVIELSKLVDAIETIRKYYAAAGYLLTDVYLPEQKFSPEGAVVQIAVVEARIGKVTTPVASGAGISEQKVFQIANAHLKPGAPIQQYELEKVIYLLKDLPGIDASAVLTAGANVGEADITIDVFARDGKRMATSLMLDNTGAKATGEYRVTALMDVDHPLNMGDQLSLRLQPTDQTGNVLARVGYTVPVGSSATKLNFSLSHSVYRLAGQNFDKLDASGSADVISATVIQPLVRGRFSNLVVTAGLDHKELRDITTSYNQDIAQTIDSVRVGLLGSSTSEIKVDADGNRQRSIFGSQGSNTIYSVMATYGKAAMTPDDDREGTVGNFAKLNFDAQRVQFLSDGLTLSLTLSGQIASRNLRGAERVSLGGPAGVRGYPVPSGTGDEGLLASAELRYRLPVQIFGMPLNALAFYDAAAIHFRKFPSDSLLSTNSSTFDSVGLGLRFGTEGKTTASLLVAKKRQDATIPTDGTQTGERNPQVWFTLQNWF